MKFKTDPEVNNLQFLNVFLFLQIVAVFKQQVFFYYPSSQPKILTKNVFFFFTTHPPLSAPWNLEFMRQKMSNYFDNSFAYFIVSMS